MQEIDLKSLVKYFFSKKLLIIVIVLFTFVSGIIYTKLIKTPLYKSNTTVLLTKAGETTVTSNDLQLNKNLVDTYREIIKSRKVEGRVINNLNLDYSVEELNKMITVESINETEIIKITVSGKDSLEVKKIANELAYVFNGEIVKLYDIENIGVVDAAEQAVNPYNINLAKEAIIYILVGLILGLGVVFVIYYFDTTVKDVKDIENSLGIPVIGVIPVVGGKRNE